MVPQMFRWSVSICLNVDRVGRTAFPNWNSEVARAQFSGIPVKSFPSSSLHLKGMNKTPRTSSHSAARSFSQS